MDFNLTEEQIFVRDVARKFADEKLFPRAGEFDKAKALDRNAPTVPGLGVGHEPGVRLDATGAVPLSSQQIGERVAVRGEGVVRRAHTVVGHVGSGQDRGLWQEIPLRQRHRDPDSAKRARNRSRTSSSDTRMKR